MLGWIFWRIKWLFLAAMVGGPVMAYFSWQDAERIKAIDTRGAAAVAIVKGATETKRRRSGTSYALDLEWKDDKGSVRTAEKVGISSGFAGRIIRDGKILVRSVPIKYLVEAPDTEPVIMPDRNSQASGDTFLIQAGSIAGGVGLLGSLALFLLGRRRKDSPT